MKAPSTGPAPAISVTASPSTSSGGGWPATAIRTGFSGSSEIARAATLQSAESPRASSARFRVERATSGSPVSAAAVRSV